MSLAENLVRLFGGREDMFAVGLQGAGKDLASGLPSVKYIPSTKYYKDKDQDDLEARGMTPADMDNHLRGVNPYGMGAYVQRGDGKCRLFVIDIDFAWKKERQATPDEIKEIEGWARKLCGSAKAMADIELFPVRSRSGYGMHVYGFLAEWTSGYLVRTAMEKVLATAGIPNFAPGVKSGWDAIFPKASKPGPQNVGSLIALPYHGYSVRPTHQQPIDYMGDPEKFVEMAESARISIKVVAELAGLSPEAEPPVDHKAAFIDDGIDELGKEENRQAPKLFWQRTANYCRLIREAIDHPDKITYDMWLAVLTWCAQFENGREIAHEVSKGYPGYSAKETDIKFDEAVKLGPFRCSTIHQKMGQTCQAKFNMEYTCHVISPMQLKTPRFEITEAEIKALPLVNGDGSKIEPSALDKIISPYQQIIGPHVGANYGKRVAGWISSHFSGYGIDTKSVLSQAKAQVGTKGVGEDVRYQRGQIERWESGTDIYYFSYRHKGGREQVSNFVLNPRELIRMKDSGDFILKCDAHLCGTGQVVKDFQFKSDAFISKQRFKMALQDLSVVFSGTDDQVQNLKDILYQQCAMSRYGTPVLGRHDDKFVLSDQVLSLKGDVTADSDLVFVDAGNSLAKIWEKFPPPSDESRIHDICRVIPKINEDRCIIPAIGWMSAAFLKPIFVKKYKQFPYLFVHGLRGSGKTSAVTKLWEVFGASRQFPEVIKITEFARLSLLSSSNALFTFFDEYKRRSTNQKEIEQFHSYLNQGYNPTVGRRGQRDQTIRNFEMTTPLIIAGESAPAESSVLERCLVVRFRKETVSADEYRAAWDELRSMSSVGFAYEMVMESLKFDFDAEIIRARDTVNQYYGGRNMIPRFLYNIACMEVGLQLFAKVCQKYDAEFEFDRASVYNMLESEVFGATSSIAQPFDQFMESLAVMSARGEISEGVEYIKREGFIFIPLRTAYSAYLEFMKKTNYFDEIFQIQTFERNAEEIFITKGYVVDLRRSIAFGGLQKRCIVVDESRMIEATKIDPIARKKEEHANHY